MASGDTINSDILIRKRDNSDNLFKVVGRFSDEELDTFDVSDPQGKVFLNAARSNNVNPPAGARTVEAPSAVFEEGEEIRIAVIAKEGPNNPLDVSGDQSQLRLRVVKVDLNTGIANPETISLADNEVTSDPAVSEGDDLLWFKDTVGTNTRVFIAGLYEAAPAEA